MEGACRAPQSATRAHNGQVMFVVLFANAGMRADTALAVSLLATGVSFVVASSGTMWL